MAAATPHLESAQSLHSKGECGPTSLPRRATGRELVERKRETEIEEGTCAELQAQVIQGTKEFHVAKSWTVQATPWALLCTWA